MADTSVNNFVIAEHYIRIIFKDTRRNNMSLLRSFEPFRTAESLSGGLFFQLTVDDSLQPKREGRERIRTFDTGNGDTVVDRYPDGGYQFIIKDIRGGECCLLQANKDFSNCQCALNGNYDMRCFGLNNALMLVFAFAGSHQQTLLIHASLVRHNGRGYAFIAKSGTGKSTHVSLWLRHIPNCDLMNDDNPIIRIIDGIPYIFGSPWSGKTPCYRPIKARLGAMTRIDRDDHNWVEKLSPIEGFTSVLASTNSLKWDVPVFRNVGDTVSKIAETTGCYILHCLPNREAAEVCNAAIAVKS